LKNAYSDPEVIHAVQVYFGCSCVHPAFHDRRRVSHQDDPLVVPSPPGGTHDLLARLIAASMSRDLDVSVVVDNRAGAGGTLGSDLAAKAPADGYTVLIADGSALAINTTLRNDLPFDAQRDLTPVSLMVRSPLLLWLLHRSRRTP
jgi:tripartite-type tricarboxylate transporter receptor subunit TctC